MTASHDRLHRFLLEGRRRARHLVRLTDAWHGSRPAPTIPTRCAAAGPALAGSALLTGNVRFRGSLSLQLKSAGPVTCCSPSATTTRCADWRSGAATVPQPLQLDRLDQPILAVTLEHGRPPPAGPDSGGGW